MLHSFAPRPSKSQAIELKTLQTKVPENSAVSLGARLKQLWHRLIDWVESTSEPRVWQKRDRHGNVIAWYVYDPQLGYTTSFSSELEVRLWFEQRHC
jgi:hypothetical protein